MGGFVPSFTRFPGSIIGFVWAKWLNGLTTNPDRLRARVTGFPVGPAGPGWVGLTTMHFDKILLSFLLPNPTKKCRHRPLYLSWINPIVTTERKESISCLSCHWIGQVELAMFLLPIKVHPTNVWDFLLLNFLKICKFKKILLTSTERKWEMGAFLIWMTY